MARCSRLLAYGAGLLGVSGGSCYTFFQYKHKKSCMPPGTRYYSTVSEAERGDVTESSSSGQHHQPEQRTAANAAAYLPPSREQMLQRMQNERFDVLVIGGGATGSSVALDAAARGLKCCLIEREDFASGTSSRSTKLLHGGIRYLQKAVERFDLKQLFLVSEALEERAHLLKAAPFMNHPVAMVVPVYTWWELPFLWIGFKAYGYLSSIVCCFQTGVPPCSLLPRGTGGFVFPLLPRDHLRGTLLHFDGQTNDSRLSLLLALTAAIDGYVEGMKGATVANYVEATKFIKDQQGRLIGVAAQDRETGKVFNIYSKAIISCAAPFDVPLSISAEVYDEYVFVADLTKNLRCHTSDRLLMKYVPSPIRRRRNSWSLQEPRSPRYSTCVFLSRGVHIVLPHWYTAASPFGLLHAKTSDGRVLFLLPWEGHTLVGTTDAPCCLSTSPAAPAAAVQWLTREVAAFLKMDEKRVRNDILSAWQGIRPLIPRIPPPAAAGSSVVALPPPEASTPAPAAASAAAAGTAAASPAAGASAAAAAAGAMVSTKDVVRSHFVLFDERTGLLSLLGGKLTTCRRMAEEALDELLKARKTDVAASSGCRTKNMLLHGAVDPTGVLPSQECIPGKGKLELTLQQQYPELSFSQLRHLVESYGFLARDVCSLSKQDASLLQPLCQKDPSLPYIRAEVVYSARHEMARNISDVLARRTPLAFLNVKAAQSCVDEVGTMLARELGWSDEQLQQKRAEAFHYLKAFQVPAEM